jgi:hypothetical protein
VDHALLVDEQKQSGEALLAALDSGKFPVDAALWWFETEGAKWLLIIASPIVDLAGPLQAYKRVISITSKDDHAKEVIDFVTLVSDRHPMVAMFRSVLGTGSTRITFSQSTIGDLYIEDAYIYRLGRYVPQPR